MTGDVFGEKNDEVPGINKKLFVNHSSYEKEIVEMLTILIEKCLYANT